MIPIPDRSRDADSTPDSTHPPLRLFGNRPPMLSFDSEADGNSAFEPRRIINGLRYHWFLFFVLGSLLAAGLGFAAWELLPSKFTTYSVLRVGATESVRLEAKDTDGRAAFVTYLKTQANLIKSEFVLRAAIRDSKIGDTETLKRQEDPIRWLEENLDIQFSENSEIMKIALTGDNAKDLAEIVNAVQAAYMKEVVHKDQTESRKKIDLLEEIRKTTEGMLKNTQDLVKGSAKASKPLDTSISAQADLNSVKLKLGVSDLARMNEDLRKAEVEWSVAASKTRQLEERYSKIDTLEVSNAEFEAILSKDLEYKSLVQRAEAAQKRAAYFRSVSTIKDQDPDVRNEVQQAMKYTAQAEDYKRKMKGDLSRSIQRAARKELDSKLDEARTSAAVNAQRYQSLKQQLANVEVVREVRDQLGKVAQDINPDETTLFQISRVHELLLHKINMLRVETQTPPRVVELQQASVPIKKEMKKQMLGSGIAALLGFALVGGLITLSEARTRRVFGTRDFTNTAGLTVIGTLPELSGGDARVRDGADPFMEAVDQIRVTLGRSFLGKKSQTIVITSAEAGEGKTTLAGHLAVSVTKTDRKTILVDCNLRTPALHDHLGLAIQPGMCDLLRGEHNLPEVVQKTAIPNLSFLSAGQWDPTSQNAIGRDRIRRILDKLRQEFDTIILDTHALLPVADTMLVSQYCDAVVVCARKYASRQPMVEQACRRVSELGVAHAGVIFLGESTR